MKATLLGLALALAAAAPASAETLVLGFTQDSWAKFTATAPTRENGVHGISHNVQGRIFVPGGRWEEAKAEIGIPVLSFAAKSGMDQHTFTSINAGKYPMVIFRSKKIEIASRTTEADGTRLAGKVTGILHFHGRQRQLTTDFTALVASESARMDTEFKFLLSEFDVERPRMAIFLVDDPVLINVSLDARKDAAVSAVPQSR